MKRKGPSRKTVTQVLFILLAVSFAGGIFGSVQTGEAADYDPQEAGHPLKILAYAVFPIGTFMDYALMRPAFWLVQKEPLRTIFGFDDMTRSDKEVNPGPMGVILENQQ